MQFSFGERRESGRRAFTLLEVAIASAIAFLVAGFIVYLISASSRVLSIVTQQSMYQQSASLLFDKISDILRNAKQRDFTIPSSSVLQFRLKKTPEVQSEISLDGDTKRVYYYSDNTETTEGELLARNIDSLQFRITSGYMVEVVVDFYYARYGTIFSVDPTQATRGTVKTVIFPRQDTMETVF